MIHDLPDQPQCGFHTASRAATRLRAAWGRLESGRWCVLEPSIYSPTRPAINQSRAGLSVYPGDGGRLPLKAFFRADAKKRYTVSWDSELRAGAMLRPAGFSSGRGDCARGGRPARHGWLCRSGGFPHRNERVSRVAYAIRKSTAQLDKSGRAVLYYWHEGMTLFGRLLPLGLKTCRVRPPTGAHRMAA